MSSTVWQLLAFSCSTLPGTDGCPGLWSPKVTPYLSNSLCYPKITMNFLSFCLQAVPVFFVCVVFVLFCFSWFCFLCSTWNGIQGLMHARQALYQWSNIFSSHLTSSLRALWLQEMRPASLERHLAILEHVAGLSFLANCILLSSELISKRKADSWRFPFYPSAQGTLQKCQAGMGLRAWA